MQADPTPQAEEAPQAQAVSRLNLHAFKIIRSRMILRGGEVINCNFISAVYGMLYTNYTVKEAV